MEKEWISPYVHPNVGMQVRMWIRNKRSGKSSYRKATWDGTHWSLEKISTDYELVGWHE